MTNDNPLTSREHRDLFAAIDDGIDRIEQRRRRRNVRAASGTAALLIAVVVGTSVVAGGSVSGQGEVAATPTPSLPRPILSASATPTPQASSPVPTAPVASPEQSSEPGLSPSAWVVTDEGIGPVRFESAIADAIAPFPDAAPCRPDGDPAYQAENGHLWIVRDYERDPDAVGVVSWARWDTDAADFRVGPKTARGIGIGSTEAEVRATYPDAQYTDVNEVQIVVRDGLVTMTVREGVVVVLSVSRTLPSEFCG